MVSPLFEFGAWNGLVSAFTPTGWLGLHYDSRMAASRTSSRSVSFPLGGLLKVFNKLFYSTVQESAYAGVRELLRVVHDGHHNS